MRAAAWIVVLLFAPLAHAEGARCATCGGGGEVACFGCDGKGSIEVPCPICSERADATCRNCGGKGSVPCKKCGGPNQPGREADSQNCVACGGRRALTCRVCARGKMPCGACKGSGKSSRACPVCGGKKKLPCPDCAAKDPCPACKGQKMETCPICQGTKKVVAPCKDCAGSGIERCLNCLGLGIVLCTNCNVVGHADKNICAKCGGKGQTPCPECKGKGIEPCSTCSGHQAERPCWACGATGTIPCRRCAAPLRAWKGTEVTSGLAVALLEVRAFEPEVIAALRDALGQAVPSLWRVVIDDRGSKAPCVLGGNGGWSLTATGPAAQVDLVGAPAVAAAESDRYAGILAGCGLTKDGGRYPLNVAAGRIATTIVWKAGAPAAEVKEFTMRRGSEEVYLRAAYATFDDYVRLRIAARRGK